MVKRRGFYFVLIFEYFEVLLHLTDANSKAVVKF